MSVSKDKWPRQTHCGAPRLLLAQTAGFEALEPRPDIAQRSKRRGGESPERDGLCRR